MNKILTEMPPRYPTSGTFELTIRCDLKCKMCLFRHDDCENATLRAKELSAEEWIRLAKEAAEAGAFSLLITGGEPMLRPDFCEIWEGIYKQGFLIELYTNATLVNDKIMETLEKYPPHTIGITIYGASEETYEKVCGNGAMFEKAVAGIKRLMTLPSGITFRTTIIKENYPDVEKIEKLVKEEFHYERDVIETRIVTASVRGACADVSKCRLDAKENIDLLIHRAVNKTTAKALEMGATPKEYTVRVSPKKEKEISTNPNSKTTYTLFGCDAGMSSFTISYDGQLLPCQLLGNYSVDLKTNTFSDAWEKLPYVCEPVNYCSDCKSCPHFDLCEACPATRYAETGDLGGKATYLCDDVQELLKRTTNKYNL